MGNLFYTVDEAANLLGVTIYTIRRWLKDGKLSGKRVGKFWRINKESVESVLPNDKSE